MASTYHVGRKTWGASRCTDTVTGPPGSQEKRWTSLKRRWSHQLRAGGWALGAQRGGQSQMPHLGSSWMTVFWAKLRKAAQKFMHTEGFQPSRSFWRGPRRRQRRVRAGVGEGTHYRPGQGTWGHGVGVQVPLPYPDVFKHLHGGKGLEGTDKTLRIAEASDNIWDTQEE